MRPGRLLVVAVALWPGAACVEGAEVADGATPQVGSLPLLERDDLPVRLFEISPPEGESAGWRAIDWGMTADVEPVTTTTLCDGDAARTLRAWNEGGELFRVPEVLHVVCVFRSVERASQNFDERTLKEIAGEDYYNLEYGSETEFIPAAWHPAELAADEAELACASGDVNQICTAWIFRARYDKVVTRVIFRDSGGGIPYEAFLRVVQGVDERSAGGGGASGS